MPSPAELERISRIVDGELPPDAASAPAVAKLRAVLDAAADLDVELAPAHLDRLVGRALAPAAPRGLPVAPRRRRLPWVAGALAAALAAAAAVVLLAPPAGPLVTDVEGTVAADGRPLLEDARVPVAAVLETGVDGTARVGDVLLGPNSRAVLGDRFELRAGVAFVTGSGREVRVSTADVTIDGAAWLVAEPAGEVDRVTEQLTHAAPETSMRSLMLALTLPAVALGATTTPGVVVTAGQAVAANQPVKAGARWQPAAVAAPSPRTAEPDPRINALQAEVDALKKQVEALRQSTAGRSTPAAVAVAQVRGTLVDEHGQSAGNVAIAMFAGDRLSDVSYTDAAGRFAIDPPADAAGVVYAKTGTRTASAAGVRPGANLSLMLTEPGRLNVKVTPPTAGNISIWTSMGGVAAAFPGTINGRQFTGGQVQLDRPAGELSVHVVNESDPRVGGHARVHLDPGGETSVTVELTTAESTIRGRVLDATTRKSLQGYLVSLLLADDSIEAQYKSEDPEFAFSHRTAGDRVMLITANGYKPGRVKVAVEAGKSVDLGPVLLQPW